MDDLILFFFLVLPGLHSQIQCDTILDYFWTLTSHGLSGLGGVHMIVIFVKVLFKSLYLVPVVKGLANHFFNPK